MAGCIARASLHVPGCRVLPYGYVVIAGPWHARSHSLSLHSRLPAATQAAPASICEMYAWGTAPRSETARTVLPPGWTYGDQSTSEASKRSMQNVATFAIPGGQPGSPGSSTRHASGSGAALGSHATESAKRGVQHSIPAEPAHAPAVAPRVPVQSATSRHDPGMPFAVHVGAALASCASGIAGTVQPGASGAPSATTAVSRGVAPWPPHAAKRSTSARITAASLAIRELDVDGHAR